MKISRTKILYQTILLTSHIYIINATHTDNNSTDVVVTYSGHSEIERQSRPVQENGADKTNTERVTDVDVTENVVFIPNDKPVFRNGDEFNGVKIRDLVETKRMDLMNDKIHLTETDSPNADILFISGKNKELKHIDGKINIVNSPVKNVKETKRLDCTNLACNNTVNSVCGRKEENKKMKYRLFLNKCFFRKVNCGFQNEFNRYNIVPIENCKYIGAHFLSRPYVFKPIPLLEPIKTSKNDTRRSFSSRRSLNMGVDGTFCSHPCPVSCTEDYDPQCAVSSSGQRKVFLNHCKLDHNSCLYKVVWHRRPLSECVGGRKADMNQNKGFIGWMQRVGIVDRKGRLMLS